MEDSVYRYGLAYRGAKARRISNEEALNKLTKREILGFLEWVSMNSVGQSFEGESCLEFNELHENDLY